MPTARAVLAATVLLIAVSPQNASAVPDCTSPLPVPQPVLTGQGVLESVIVDARGRLFYTDGTLGALMRLDRPGAAPVVVSAGIKAPGGLAFDADGRHLFVGQGDSLAGGLQGNVAPVASLLRVDVDTGTTTTFATGLRMANGLVRAADGTLFASADVTTTLDRIGPDGKVQSDWATVVSGNGLAIDRAQRNLFVNQTFQPAAITRIPLDAPGAPQTFFSASGPDIFAGLDGMTIDPADRLISTANLAGEVWRIGTDGKACALGRGLRTTSAAAYGQGPVGFSEGRLFAVGFDGVIAEIPGGRLPVTDPVTPAAASRPTLLPRTAAVRSGAIRVVLHVEVAGRYVRSVVRIAGQTVQTGRRVTLRVPTGARRLKASFEHAGKRVVRTITLRR